MQTNGIQTQSHHRCMLFSMYTFPYFRLYINRVYFRELPCCGLHLCVRHFLVSSVSDCCSASAWLPAEPHLYCLRFWTICSHHSEYCYTHQRCSILLVSASKDSISSPDWEHWHTLLMLEIVWASRAGTHADCVVTAALMGCCSYQTECSNSPSMIRLSNDSGRMAAHPQLPLVLTESWQGAILHRHEACAASLRHSHKTGVQQVHSIYEQLLQQQHS